MPVVPTPPKTLFETYQEWIDALTSHGDFLYYFFKYHRDAMRLIEGELITQDIHALSTLYAQFRTHLKSPAKSKDTRELYFCLKSAYHHKTKEQFLSLWNNPMHPIITQDDQIIKRARNVWLKALAGMIIKDKQFWLAPTETPMIFKQWVDSLTSDDRSPICHEAFMQLNTSISKYFEFQYSLFSKFIRVLKSRRPDTEQIKQMTELLNLFPSPLLDRLFESRQQIRLFADAWTNYRIDSASGMAHKVLYQPTAHTRSVKATKGFTPKSVTPEPQVRPCDARPLATPASPWATPVRYRPIDWNAPPKQSPSKANTHLRSSPSVYFGLSGLTKTPTHCASLNAALPDSKEQSSTPRRRIPTIGTESL